MWRLILEAVTHCTYSFIIVLLHLVTLTLSDIYVVHLSAMLFYVAIRYGIAQQQYAMSHKTMGELDK